MTHGVQTSVLIHYLHSQRVNDRPSARRGRKSSEGRLPRPNFVLHFVLAVPGAHHFLAFDLRLSTFFRPSTLQLSTILVRLGRHSTTDSTGRTSIIVNVSKPQ